MPINLIKSIISRGAGREYNFCNGCKGNHLSCISITFVTHNGTAWSDKAEFQREKDFCPLCGQGAEIDLAEFQKNPKYHEVVLLVLRLTEFVSENLDKCHMVQITDQRRINLPTIVVVFNEAICSKVTKEVKSTSPWGSHYL